MPPTDVKAAVRSPEQSLQLLLGVVAAGALIHAIWPVAASVRQLSNQPTEARKLRAAIGALVPPEVLLGHVKQRALAEGETARNPFKFHMTPTTPKPVELQAPAPLKRGDQGSAVPLQPSLPPIPIKFIGVAEQGTKKVAIFSDGKGSPVWASAGQTVLGEYKLLMINVESVTMSYLDGSGTRTIPMRG